MLTRRQVVIEKPFKDMRYKNHRRKVQSALPRIDSKSPPKYVHLDIKMKKLRLEWDRQNQICNDNIRLLQRMASIMRSKRIDNINNSPKGPFAPKKTPIPRPKSQVCKEDQSSFMEKLTIEASKLVTIRPSKFVEHRSPHGYCKVPELDIQTKFGSKNKRLSPKARSFGKKSPEVKITSIQEPIDEPTQNQISSTGSSLIQNQNGTKSKNTRVKSARLVRSSRTLNLDLQQYNYLCHEEVSSEAEGGSSLSSTDNSYRVEEDANEKNLNYSKEQEIKSNSLKSVQKRADSDEHVTSILLGVPPNITIDEASDDDFYN